MEKGFILPNGNYVQAIDAGHLTAADYPEGTVEVPLKPGEHYEWNWPEWVYVAPPETTIEELRATATMPKDDFILAALDAGVLSETDAEEATNGWPAGFDAFFEGQPARSRIKAKARWAAATHIARNAPLIKSLAKFKKLSPEQVDALFGIGEMK